jgi:hypothetical protein
MSSPLSAHVRASFALDSQTGIYLFDLRLCVRLETLARRPAAAFGRSEGGSAALMRNDMPDRRLSSVGQKEMRGRLLFCQYCARRQVCGVLAELGKLACPD